VANRLALVRLVEHRQMGRGSDFSHVVPPLLAVDSLSAGVEAPTTIVCLLVGVRDPGGLHTFRTNRTRQRTACDHEARSLDIDRRSLCAVGLRGNGN
jgi:hypothetical protein